MLKTRGLLLSTLLGLLLLSLNNYAAITSYLPVSQQPNIERKIDSLLLIANSTNLKRPIAVNKLRQAWTQVCHLGTEAQSSLVQICKDIEFYLARYNNKTAVTDAGLTINSSDRDNSSLANQRGVAYQENLTAFVKGYAQLNPYIGASLGIQATESSTYLEDTFVSLGTDWAQIDIGTKPHWFSPFKHSAMLISTHAETIPTLSVSNSTPLSFLNINYEVFVGKLSTSDRIRYQDEFITGDPIITGMHFEFSPFTGFSLAVNRLLQSGGGERDGSGFEDLLKAFFDPSGSDNISDELGFDEQFGNQNASITGQFTFSGPNPLSIYLEYAGEDTSRGSNWRLGNSALSAGIFIPFLTPSTSLRYEWSEWQNAWYSHSVYKDGMTNNGNIIGHWAAEYRALDADFNNNAVGGTHNFVELNWQAARDHDLTFQLSHTSNENYGSIEYEDAYKALIRWHTSYNSWSITSELESGQNAFGQGYYRLSAKVGI